MPEYLLYGLRNPETATSPRSTWSSSGADWKPRFVDYFNGETRTRNTGRFNAMARRPCWARQVRLRASGVILDYLVERFGRFGWKRKRVSGARSCAGSSGTIQAHRLHRHLPLSARPSPRRRPRPDKAIVEIGKRARVV